jgi:ribosomal-protein-alanine N-acetyltransferase
LDYNKLFNKFPYIHNNKIDSKIILKKIEKEDVDDLYEICSNEKLYLLRTGNAKKSFSDVEKMVNRFEKDFINKKTVFLGIYLEQEFNKLVGIVEIFAVDDEIDVATIGYTLNENYWGQGIATKAVNLVINFLFDEVQIYKIQGFIMSENMRSKKVLIRNNFIKEKIIKQEHLWIGNDNKDMEIYSLLKKEFKKDFN